MHFDNDSSVGEDYDDSANGSIVFDSSNFFNNGTTNSTKGFPPQFTPSGKFSGAFLFGKDSYIEVNDSTSLDIVDSFTLEAWVNIKNLSKTKNRIISKGIVNGTFGTLNATNRSGVSFRRSSGGLKLGDALSTGDFNNDGIDDLIITDSQSDPPGDTDAGHVYIFYGPLNDSGEYVVNGVTPTGPDIIIQGTINNQKIGTGVGSGDFNNDGIDDIIIGADQDEPSGGNGEGRVFIFFGPTNISGIFDVTDANVTFVGKATNDAAGIDVGSGDFNNDGIDDVLIVAAFAKPADISASGEVYIFYGPINTTGTGIVNTSDANVTIYGLATGGIHSAASGDLNNDGIDDIIMGSVNAEPAGGSNRGGIFIIFGPTNVSGIFNVSKIANVTYAGDSNNDQFGERVGTGDVNNDGIDDLFITSENGPLPKVYLMFGPIRDPSSSEILEIQQNANISYLAAAVLGNGIASGDLNNDGIDDLIMGSDILRPTYVNYGPINLNENYNLMVSEKGAAVLSFQNTSGKIISVKTVNNLITENKFHHIAGVVDTGANIMRIYIDGVEQASKNFSGNPISNEDNQSLFIGAFRGGISSNLNGTIDELAIWNVSLGQSDIEEHYKRGVLKLNISYRTSDDNVTFTSYTTVDNSTLSSVNVIAKYFQYRANLTTTSLDFSPVLQNVTLNYTPTATDSSGDYNYTITAFSTAGFYEVKVNTTYLSTTISGEKNATLEVLALDLNITLTLTPSIVGASAQFTVSGFINLTNGTNVTDNLFRLFLNGTEQGINQQFIDDESTFSSGTLTNVTIDGKNITLLKNGSNQYPNKTGIFVSQAFTSGTPTNWTYISWNEDLNNSKRDLTVLINDSLLLLFHFNNDTSVGENYNDSRNGSNIYDYSSFFNNGTSNSTQTFPAQFTTAGKFSGALDFDGIGNYIIINDSKIMDLNTSFTLEAWVNIEDLTITKNRIISKGKSNGTNQLLINASSYDVIFNGIESPDYFGNAIASGDFNNDGLIDIAFGAINAEQPTGDVDTGEAYIIYGAIKLTGTYNIATDANLTYFGLLKSDGLGNDATAGDFNNDGITDLVISSNQAEPVGGAANGEVYILYGPLNNSGTLNISESINVTIFGALSNDQLGTGLGTGDFNNDNIDDLIIGAEGAKPTGVSSQGESYVIYGPINNSGTYNISVIKNISFYGKLSGDGSGRTVGSGDLNNDGIEDLVVGAYNADPFVDKEGETYVLFGPINVSGSYNLSTFNVTFFGEKKDDNSGSSVSSGDINHDGFDDLIIAAHRKTRLAAGSNLEGKTYIIYGPLNKSGIFNLSDVSNLTYDGQAKLHRLGQQVHIADINNDGIDDLMQTEISFHDSEIGQSFIYYGPQSIDENYNLIVTEKGAVSMSIQNSTGKFISLKTADNLITENTFHHIAGVVDTGGKEMRIYVDGVEQASKEFSGIPQTNDISVTIGSFTGGYGGNVNGIIDELAIWNLSLSASDIEEHFKRGALTLDIRYRTSDDNITFTDYTSVSNSTISSISVIAKYLQYKANLTTSFVNLTPRLFNVTINYSGIYTDSAGNYNHTLTALSTEGTYEVKVNTTLASTTISNEKNASLIVDNPPVINFINATPNPIGVNKIINITANVTDNFGVSDVTFEFNNSRNYTMFTDAGDIYYVNTTLVTSSIGNYNYTIYVNDTIGQTTTQSGNFTVTSSLNITLTLTPSTVGASAQFTVSGHINLTNGTNVSNNLINFYLNNSAAAIVSGFISGLPPFNFIDDISTDFNKGTFTNTTTDGKNVTLNKNGSSQYPNQTGIFTSQAFYANNIVNWTYISWIDDLNYKYNKDLQDLINTSLVLLFHFNNDSSVGENYDDSSNGSTIFDSSEYANNGTTNSSLDSPPQFIPSGKFGGAFSFDGKDDYIEINSSSSLDINESFTLEAWINIKNLTKTSNRIITKSRVNGTNFTQNVSNYDVVITGALASDATGSAVGSGDLNNDGFADLIIGANLAEPTGAGAQGATYIIYGPLNSSKSFNVSIANVTFFGKNGVDQSGIGVAAGDLNNDGIDDLIVGAYNAESPGELNNGVTYIIYGPTNVSGNFNLSTSNLTFFGKQNIGALGFGVSSGDFNNDGIGDLILGDRDINPPGGNAQGETYIFYGPLNVSGSYNVSIANVTFFGIDAGDLSGNGVGSGDFNNDGIDDIIIGALHAEPFSGGNNQGETYIIYGPTNASGNYNLSDANVTFFGIDEADGSGWNVDSGDFNNDGIDDVIIGAYLADLPGGDDQGESYIIYGPLNDSGTYNISDAVNVTFHGINDNDNAGNDVGFGDLNNDGIGDLIIGTDGAGVNSVGETYIIYGPLSLDENYNLMVDEKGAVVFSLQNLSNGNFTSLRTPRNLITTDTFHHIAATFDSGRGLMSIYVDGILKASKAFSGTPNINEFPVTIGSFAGGLGSNLNGTIDEVAIWNLSLTQKRSLKAKHQLQNKR